MNLATTPTTAHITGWDRAVIILLGAAGCALSYDALQQMAVAIHVRGFLTYLFPLVIDGFIAYGVRALLVLRTAPLGARAYVWTLFGTATTASIWANALHAVRLNELATRSGGLRLGDTVVAILSTLAPLALAGAVHLYILIARGPAGDGHRRHLGHRGQTERIPVTRPDRPGQKPASGQVTPGQPISALTPPLGQDSDRPALTAVTQDADGPMATEDSTPADSTTPDTEPDRSHPADPALGGADLRGHPETAATDTDRPDNRRSVTAPPVSRPTDDRPKHGHPVTDRTPETARPVTDPDSRTTGDRKVDPDTERLLEIAREAVMAQDKLTRKVVADAIRGQEIPLSNDRLTALMVRLRETNGQRNRGRAEEQPHECRT
ncbi:DUF2637 domain-containing protein [Streptantibioticus ferralitis]|uniref:DUF2637 domain-containing protein n=1 Tax=Streptantibioticus ferralitis TaxID=236510 RepID=A0ABT5YSM2_9ACTN|nr:DUF2637 domain-containing protein [Streptantibioticus ferralitis]MDF2254372.1 DUF2637 domain-containing protein [Streptantibioticus ferralitis]